MTAVSQEWDTGQTTAQTPKKINPILLGRVARQPQNVGPGTVEKA